MQLDAWYGKTWSCAHVSPEREWKNKKTYTHIKNKERNQKTQGINNRDRKKRARAAAPCPCLTTLVQSVSQLAS